MCRPARLAAALGVALAVLASLALTLGEATAAATSDSPSIVAARIPTQEKVVALTFDDAWIDADLESILDTLKATGVKATFFPTGSGVESSPELARRIVAEGHELGSHAYTHSRMRGMTKDELVWQIQKTEEAFSKAGLKDPVPLFRAPWGEVTRKMREVMRAEGYVDIMWTVRGLDTEPGLSSELVVARVLRLVRPGYIVVLHTRNAAAPKALPEIIRQLKADGYRFVTVGEAFFTPEQRMPRYQQTSPLLGYLGSWHERPSPLETGGSISEAESPEAGVLVSFTGTTLELICAIGPKRGEILVTIDGETPEEVDLYSPAEYHRVTVFSKSDLADTSHTALVSWAGAKNPASSGYSIDVDALRVSGELTQAPKPAVFLLRRAITRLIAACGL